MILPSDKRERQFPSKTNDQDSISQNNLQPKERSGGEIQGAGSELCEVQHLHGLSQRTPLCPQRGFNKHKYIRE